MEMRRKVRRVGLIGDVHAEAVLLERAIAFLLAQGADTLCCTGDLTDGFGDLERCCKLLIDHQVLTVAGNHDRWCIAGELRNRPECTEFTQLSAIAQRFLRQLPVTRELMTPQGCALLCHGVGDHDMGKVLPEDSLSHGQANPELQGVLQGDRYRYLLNGHSHYRMVKAVGQWGELIVINGGTLKKEHEPGFVLIDFGTGQVQAYDFNPWGQIVPAESLPLPWLSAVS